jgi:gas vesicle protein
MAAKTRKKTNAGSEKDEAPKRRGAGGKIFTGALAGAAIGVAAALFLTSQTGKKLRKNLSARAADFYKYISPQLRKLRRMSQEEYEAFIDEAVKRYGKLKKLSGPEILALAREAKKVWGQLAKYLD